MKHLFLFIILIISTQAFGTIRRVNNNPEIALVPGLVYANLSTALADVLDGDTIYLEPSSTSYSASTISKRIVLIGNGYQLESNANTISPISANRLESKITNSFNFASGSSNSIVYGVVFSFSFSIDPSVSGLTFNGCTFSGGINIFGNNNSLINCQTSLANNVSGSGLNTLIQSSILGILQLSNAVVDHCYIDNLNSGTNNTFNNCLIEQVNPNLSTTNSIAFCLKIPNGTSVFPQSGINNNIENLSDRTTIFIVADPSSGNSISDKNFMLKSGSPALATGTNGSDMGIFGGNIPYKLSGQPPIPIITNFFISNTGSIQSGLSGSITIQSNN